MPKNIICTVCSNMKTPLGRCLTCNPVDYYRKLPPKKKPKRTPSQVRTAVKSSKRLRKRELLWRAIEILLLVDEILERDPNGEIVLYADKQKLAAEVKNIILPFMIHTRTLFGDSKPSSPHFMTPYSAKCLIALRERLAGVGKQKSAPYKHMPAPPTADEILKRTKED